MLYIMRHGKTDWNEIHKLQGRTDIPLNEEGRQMAKRAADECKNIHFDICFSSPLCRALETAKLVLEGREIEVITDDRLVEMSFGVYEGMENSFDIPDCPVNELFYHPESYEAVEGGESLDELFARTGDFLKEVVEPRLLKGEDILIVGHGAMNSSIVCQRRGMERKDFWKAGIENCKLMKL